MYEDTNSTQATYCALLKWWRFQPIIRINTRFRPVDPTCFVLTEPGDDRECLKSLASPASPASQASPVVAVTGSSASVVLALMVGSAVIIVIFVISLRRKR